MTNNLQVLCVEQRLTREIPLIADLALKIHAQQKPGIIYKT